MARLKYNEIMSKAVKISTIISLAIFSYAFVLFIEATGTFTYRGYTYNNTTIQDPFLHSGVDGPYLHWNSPNITYRINVDAIEPDSRAVFVASAQNAFSTWESVTPATIDFSYGGTTSTGLNPNDGQNVVFWDTNDYGALAVTFFTYNRSNEQIVDSDINLNSLETWSPDALDFDNRIWDIQSIITHEAGHLLGLTHPDALPGETIDFQDPPTMASTPWWINNALALLESPNLGLRTLNNDDNGAINYLYGNTLRVPDVFTTIGDALGFAQSGQTILVAAGTHTVSSTLTVPTGVTLQINSGTTIIKFVSAASLIVNGSLQAVGTSGQLITFDRSGTTGKWGGIRIENSTASSSLDYCTIRNGTYGVRLNNTTGNVNVNHATLTNNTTTFQALYSSPFTIQNSTIQNNSYGIYVRSSAVSGDMKILSNNLSANIIRSIYLYDGADAFLGANTITNDIEGITCTTNSDPIIRRSSGNYGYNTIRNNSGPGVKAVANSYPSLGINDPAQTKYGYNEIHSNGGYEVENGNSSGMIMAERNYWSSDHNVPANPSDTYGSVDYLPVLPEGPPPPAPAGGSRVLAKSSITFDEAFDLEIRDEYQAAADLYYKLRPMILTPTM